VRLSMEEVSYHKFLIQEGGLIAVPLNVGEDLCDTIEAQQQEIESLKNWNACEAEDHERLLESDKRRIELEEEIEQLKNTMIQAARGSAGIVDLAEENVKLQAQAGVIREALWYIRINGYSLETDKLIGKALSSDAGKDYHNPADVVALKKGKEALTEAISCTTSGRLCSIGCLNNTYSAQISTSSVDKWANALAAIEKSLGGEQ
jgi:hypothetical protein